MLAFAGVLTVVGGCTAGAGLPGTASLVSNRLLLGTVRQKWTLPAGKPLAITAAGPNHVAVAMQEGDIAIRDRVTGEITRGWDTERPLLALLTVGERDQEVAAVAADGTVILLSPFADDPLKIVSTGLEVSRAGRWFGARRLWLRHQDEVTMLDLKSEAQWPAHEGGKWLATALSPVDDRLLLTREDGPATLRYGDGHAASSSPEVFPEEMPYELMPAFAPDGQAWALAGEEVVWVERAETAGRIRPFDTGIAAPRSVAFLQDGRSIGVAGRGMLALLRQDNGRVMHRWTGTAAPAWLPLGKDLVHTLTPGFAEVCFAGDP